MNLDADTQGPEPDSRNVPEHHPSERAKQPSDAAARGFGGVPQGNPGIHPQLFSSRSFVRARSSDGSFSMARSSIWTAFALSPCLALISPR